MRGSADEMRKTARAPFLDICVGRETCSARQPVLALGENLEALHWKMRWPHWAAFLSDRQNFSAEKRLSHAKAAALPHPPSVNKNSLDKKRNCVGAQCMYPP